MPEDRHNYLIKIGKLLEEGKIAPSKVNFIVFLHDSWCGIHAGKRCDCDPDIELPQPVQFGVG